ncbi:MAG: hypothetical protein ABUK01_11995 [Leptospirales bacterium]
MKLRAKAFFLGIMLVFTILSCSTIQTSLKQSDIKRMESLTIPMQGFNIQIIDTRPDVTSRLLFIPVISFPGQHDRISPRIPDDFKENLNNVLKNIVVPGEKKYIFIVSILKAYQQFDASTFYEREYIYIELQTELIDEENNVRIDISKTEYWLDFRSIDASHEHINELFSKALVLTFSKTLTQLNPAFNDEVQFF